MHMALTHLRRVDLLELFKQEREYRTQVLQKAPLSSDSIFKPRNTGAP